MDSCTAELTSPLMNPAEPVWRTSRSVVTASRELCPVASKAWTLRRGGDHDVELSVAVEVGERRELSPEPCRYLGKPGWTSGS